jgi:hypothetical protein
MRFLLVFTVLLAGCAGELENPERFANCPPGFVEQLFQTRCAGMCHDADTPEAGLDLVSADVQARLIDVPSGTPFCEGRVMIDSTVPADPNVHLIIDKLQETPSCGSRMPFGAEALTTSEIECVRRWVDESLGVSP